MIIEGGQNMTKWGFAESWGYPHGWMVSSGNSHLEMDENWGYPVMTQDTSNWWFTKKLKNFRNRNMPPACGSSSKPLLRVTVFSLPLLQVHPRLDGDCFKDNTIPIPWGNWARDIGASIQGPSGFQGPRCSKCTGSTSQNPWAGEEDGFGDRVGCEWSSQYSFES